MREVRRAIPPERRARAGEVITARVLALPAMVRARTVFLFASFGSEVPTEAVADALLSSGRRVLLPFLEGSVMEAAELRAGDEAVDTTYGPKEPPVRTPVDPEDVDVVLVPGLAFDREGYRVGYGGGHYDRYLRRLGRHATRIGIAFQEQLVDRVPREPDDDPVDLVVTDGEIIACWAEDPD
jgi:5-formyltetrahydrofolate cyclo-ligase